MTRLTERLIELEDEFNSRIKDICISFAEAGHTMTDTAKILEIDRRSFTRLMRHTGLNARFRRGGYNKKNLAKAHISAWEKYAYELDGILGCGTDHAKRYGLKYGTFRYRMENNIPLDRPISKNPRLNTG